jgi:uncharacterized RDD family membrane protein YckC
MTDHPLPRPSAPSQAVGLGARFLARLIDAVLIAVVGGAIGVAMDFNLVWLVVQALLAYGYFVVLDVAMGATVGKRVLGLGVRGPGHRRPSAAEAARREAFVLLGAVPFAGPALALVAWVAIVLTVRSSAIGEGVHDRFAGGTLVVADHRP